eukprot:jgi/Hompol1/3212/HPOL_001593-RA
MTFALNQIAQHYLSGPKKSMYAVMLYMGQFPHGGLRNLPLRLAYPESTAVIINQAPVVGFTGIKKKPWTCRPADLTAHIRLEGANSLQIRYICPEQPYAAVVALVELTEVKNLCQQLFVSSLVTREEVLRRRKATELEDEVQATLEQVPLRDSISQSRITIPIRSHNCKHIQCFDCETYLTINRQVPTWECPICSKPAPFTSLFVDGYLIDIIQQCGDADMIEITPDGEWRVGGTATAPESTQPDRSIKNESGSTEADQDAFVIDDEDETPIRQLTMKRPPPPTVAKPTPPKSLKREAASVVIDLTLSDDDDGDDCRRYLRRQHRQHQLQHRSFQSLCLHCKKLSRP